ncbi:glycosyltransferase [Acidianus infernus]|uniref:Glycosyltransferase n=1 Tax=Acidianus infernus TaxID=12915 RepID=A0A6A9QDA7_ACIIN|nr:glycosyltransferase [Acidianus infernus]MUM65232.1 glycosyltransferase [Acidianus infernus]
MRILLHSYLLEAGSGGVKRNREVIKYWKKYVDEIIYVPLLGDMRRASEDEEFRKKMYNEIKALGLEIPEKVNEVIDSEVIKRVPLNMSKLKFDLYSNITQYKINSEISKIMGKIDADIYYAQQEFPQMVDFLTKIAKNRNVGALIHIENFLGSLTEDLSHFYRAYKSMGLSGIMYACYVTFLRSYPRRRKWVELINSRKVKFAFSVSEPLAEIYPFMRKIYTRVLKPGNAFDKKLLDFRDKGKEDYSVFYARLSPAKGVLELLKIWRKIDENKKLVIMGKFSDKRVEKLFMKNKPKNVEYLGFVSQDKLIDVVSKAKVLVYPSHSDSFSLTILESLALGTPVIAYKIPGIRRIYEGLNAVKLVKEGDLAQFRQEIRKIYDMPTKEYEDLINDKKLWEFLDEHSSWEKVALNELEELKKVV